MSRRSVGLGLLVIGGVIFVIGLAGWIASETGGGDETGTTSTTAPVAGPTQLPSSTVPTVATTTTTLTPSTTTLPPSTTTTTIDFTSEIESFLQVFVADIAADDTDDLMARLHPAVLLVYDEELCRSFVQREILALEDYRLDGPISGPTPTTIGTSQVDMYQAPVAFTFQGQDFESTATFAFLDGQVRWFTQCR